MFFTNELQTWISYRRQTVGVRSEDRCILHGRNRLTTLLHPRHLTELEAARAKSEEEEVRKIKKRLEDLNTAMEIVKQMGTATFSTERPAKDEYNARRGNS